MNIAFALCLVASIYDGDTIRCADGTRLRLAGIDAPEISCQRRRPCNTSGAIESRDNLRRLAPAGTTISFRLTDANKCRRGFQATDPFGRSVVQAFSRGVDLGSAQLQAGYAVRWSCR